MLVDNYLQSFADLDQPPLEADVSLLSGLSAEEVEALEPAWSALPPVRRHEVVAIMVELADADVELDFEVFLVYALGDSDASVRERAATGLWESNDRRIIPKLIATMTDDTDADVRAAAAVVLGQFALQAEAGKLLPQDGPRIYDALLDMLQRKDEDLVVRRRLLEAAGVFDTEDVGGWIRWAYNNDEPVLRQSAVFAMGRSCNPAWLSVIIDELDSDDPGMRYEAANAARDQAEAEAVPHLAKLIGDADVQVQLAAVHALGAIGGDAAQRVLRSASSSSDATLKEAAEEAIQATDLGEPRGSSLFGH